MSILATLSLRLLHFVYTLAILAHSYWKHLTWTPPNALRAERKRIPKHLGLLLFPDVDSELTTTKETFLQNVIKVVMWCRAVGIEKLTVYDEHGILLNCTEQIRERVVHDYDSTSTDSSESEVEYPPTPPPSDYSESRPISRQDNVVPTITMHFPSKSTRRTPQRLQNVVKKRRSAHKLNESCTHQKPLTLCLISRESAKPAIAAAARSLVTSQNRRLHSKHQNTDQFKLSVDALESLLEDEFSLSPPDFMIVQPIISPSQALELHGFPPWHIRLTEIYHDKFAIHPNPLFKRPAYTQSLSETGFREALDEFARAEMRFGK